MQAVEPIVAEDEYEPPPHVVARLWGGVVKLFRLAFRGPPERTRWQYVWPTLFAALTYTYLSQHLSQHLPYRFLADGRWLVYMAADLTVTAQTDIPEFLTKVATYGKEIVFIGPVLEELMFRGLPILIARFAERRLSPSAGRGVALLIAAMATLLFAWVHHPVVGAMPLPQLVFGALAWTVAWRWGLRYSVLLHLCVNLIFMFLIVERIMMLTG